jgi:hypothetical protein
MTYKLKLNQVREILGLAVKLESVVLSDGVTINYERLEPGYPVFAEDGTTPLAEGTYVMEDGVSIVVDENGIIVEVVQPEEPAAPSEEETPAEEMEETPEEEVPSSETSDQDTIAKLAEDMKTVMEALVNLADEVAALKDQVTMAEQKVKEFAKAPATTKIPKVSVPSESKVDRMASTIDIIKSAIKK